MAEPSEHCERIAGVDSGTGSTGCLERAVAGSQKPLEQELEAFLLHYHQLIVRTAHLTYGAGVSTDLTK